MEMYTALNNSGELIYADQVTKNTQTFKCPGCNDAVFLKKGVHKIAHFSHYAKSICKTFSEGESVEHLKGKKLIYEYLVSKGEVVSMEPFLPELYQRPDLLWKKQDGTTLAIEFQCSPLSSRRMLERSNGYKEAGYDVIWILGSKFLFKGKLTPFHKLALKENNSGTIILTQLGVYDAELLQYSNFKVQNGQQCSYQLDIFAFEDQLRSSKTKFITLGKKFPLLKRYTQLENQFLAQSKEVKPFFKLIYLNMDSLISIPLELYQTVNSEWMIKTNPFEWKYLLLLWIETMSINQVITKRKLRKWLETMFSRQRIAFYKTPFISSEKLFEPLIQFLDILTKTNVLKKTGNNKWTVKEKARRFNSIEEKQLIMKQISKR